MENDGQWAVGGTVWKTSLLLWFARSANNGGSARIGCHRYLVAGDRLADSSLPVSGDRHRRMDTRHRGRPKIMVGRYFLEQNHAPPYLAIRSHLVQLHALLHRTGNPLAFVRGGHFSPGTSHRAGGVAGFSNHTIGVGPVIFGKKSAWVESCFPKACRMEACPDRGLQWR